MLAPLVFAVVIIYLAYKYFNNTKFRDIKKIPGPKPVPILGNALDFGTKAEAIFANQMRIIQEYGTFVRVWIGSQLTIMLSDPDKIEIILSSPKHTKKSSNYDAVNMWLGNGLVNSSGEHWKRHRKIITPTFHFKILEGFVDFTNHNLNILISKLHQEVGKKSVQIYPILNLYNLDLISETAMCTKINAQCDVNCKYPKAAEGFFEISMNRIFSFYKRFDVLFHLTEEYKTQKKYVKLLKDFSENVIQKRKTNLTSAQNEEQLDDFGIKRKTAFLDLLLNLKKEESLTDDEIREEVDTFIFAGSDSLTTTMSFCLLVLSKHPEIQKKMVQESNEIMGDDKNADVTFKHLQDLKYAELVIKESLRYRCTVPFFERELLEDITLDGLSIPKGTNIQIVPYALHRNEKYYPQPEKFDPDRFLPENCAKRHPYAFIPFSAGPRNCIGQKYAMLNAKAALVKILRNFEVLPADPECEPILFNAAVLKSVNGVQVQLKLRK